MVQREFQLVFPTMWLVSYRGVRWEIYHGQQAEVSWLSVVYLHHCTVALSGLVPQR